MPLSLPTFEKRRLLIGVTLVSVGLLVFFTLIGWPSLMSFPLAGIFIVLPLIWLLDDAFPLVKGTTEEDSLEDPIMTLRHRYANGEIDDDEFERRLDYLIQTEDIEIQPTKEQRSDQLPEFNSE